MGLAWHPRCSVRIDRPDWTDSRPIRSLSFKVASSEDGPAFRLLRPITDIVLCARPMSKSLGGSRLEPAIPSPCKNV